MQSIGAMSNGNLVIRHSWFPTGGVLVSSNGGVTWTQKAKLTADDAAEYDYFGHAVAISGDYAVVGAYFDNDAGDSSGSAYLFLPSDCLVGTYFFTDTNLGYSCEACPTGRFNANETNADACEACLVPGAPVLPVLLLLRSHELPQ